jgi:transcriptional regulator with XRE-family HTH domain
VCDRSEASLSGAERSVGAQLRVKRRENGMSLRELARRLDVSASLVSQIETGKSQPSVRTLYAIATELGLSLDEMLERGGPPAHREQARPVPGEAWRRIAIWGEDGVEFALASYAAASVSSPPRCADRRFGIVVSGDVSIAAGVEEHALGTGDSISLWGDGAARVRNDGPIEAKIIWVLLDGARRR